MNKKTNRLLAGVAALTFCGLGAFALGSNAQNRPAKASDDVPQKPHFAAYFTTGKEVKPFVLNLYKKSKQMTQDDEEVACHGLIFTSFNGGMQVDEDVVLEATPHEDGSADIKYRCGRMGSEFTARLVYDAKTKTFTAEDIKPVDADGEDELFTDCYLEGAQLRYVKPLK